MRHFERTKAQTFRMVVQMVIVAVISAMMFGFWQSGMGWMFLVVAVLAGVQACFIAFNILRRKAYVSIHENGVIVHRILQSFDIAFADMTWAKIELDKRIGLIAYKPNGGEEKFVGVTLFPLTPEQKMELKGAIWSVRPDLPTDRPEAGV